MHLHNKTDLERAPRKLDFHFFPIVKL
uniref:Uncharacterized protein n=1 Tax=Arundo donax TaxID=35708 RepID=A0A0A8ZWB7_ARUDO